MSRKWPPLMPISGDLVKQGAGGASTPMWVPTFQLIIIKITSQSRLLGEHLSRFSEQSEEENIIKAIRGSPRERAVSKMGPAAHWLTTHRKEKRQQFLKKSLRVQVVRGLIFQECFSAPPLRSSPISKVQGAGTPWLLLIAAPGARGWFSGILLMEKNAKLKRLDASSFCEPLTLSTDTVPVAGKSSCSWQKPCHSGRNWAKSSKPSKTEQSGALAVLKSRFSMKDLGRTTAGLGPG